MKKAVGTGLSPTVGNGIAYFALWYLENSYNVLFDDPEMALVFAGGLAGTLLLQVSRVTNWIGGVIGRYVEDKLDVEEDDDKPTGNGP